MDGLYVTWLPDVEKPLNPDHSTQVCMLSVPMYDLQLLTFPGDRAHLFHIESDRCVYIMRFIHPIVHFRCVIKKR